MNHQCTHCRENKFCVFMYEDSKCSIPAKCDGFDIKCAGYLENEESTINHHCQISGCNNKIMRDNFYFCQRHWSCISPDLKRKIWSSYRHEIKEVKILEGNILSETIVPNHSWKAAIDEAVLYIEEYQKRFMSKIINNSVYGRYGQIKSQAELDTGKETFTTLEDKIKILQQGVGSNECYQQRNC